MKLVGGCLDKIDLEGRVFVANYFFEAHAFTYRYPQEIARSSA